MRRPGIYEQFSHDDADNLLGMDAPQEGQPHRATVKGDRLLIQGDHHFEYDEFGNLTAERWGKQQCRARLYEWDCEHRLVRLTQVRWQDGGETQKESWRYRYDAFGRRWRKEDEQTGKATLFFWQDERMVTECDEDDALFDPREVDNEYVKATAFACTSYLYEPGSFRPLAQFKGRGRGGAVYWYINDHLGTPQELVDGKGNIAWSGMYRSYGQLVVQGGAVRQPLRLQGQYADEESGLHYNRYRYYNPRSGRYISQDPISIRGGINTYAYVKNPLNSIDPLGLACIQVDSRIKESDKLVKEAEISGRSHQASIDRLTEQLAQGNTNPGIGSKPIGHGISEARARDGARVYFRQTPNGIEILGKSTKANQQKVINEVILVFGRGN